LINTKLFSIQIIT